MPFANCVGSVATLSAARPALRMVMSLLLLALGHAVTATPVEARLPGSMPDLLPQLYARYLSDGRSDVEIHLSPAGTYASARTRPMADGSFSCRVSGLRFPGRDLDADDGRLQLAALLVHEVTHCFVAPYVADLSGDAEYPVALAANRLVLLSTESISDARAVIEIFRHDGSEAAQALVAMMLPVRLNPANFGHSTALALRAALAHTQRWPESLQTSAQAFAVALEIGRHSALQTLTNKLLADSQQDMLHSSEFKRIGGALDAALAQAQRAFGSGRFANNAFTLRLTNDAASAADQHFFIDADRGLRNTAAISAEGAHSLVPLQTMIVSSQAPEHSLAVRWLLHEGTLDSHSLARLRQILGRFIRAVSDGSPTQRDRVTRVIGEAIENCRRGEDISAVLDTAAEQLRVSTK